MALRDDAEASALVALWLSAGPGPILLFGPTGAGKTRTVMQALVASGSLCAEPNRRTVLIHCRSLPIAYYEEARGISTGSSGASYYTQLQFYSQTSLLIILDRIVTELGGNATFSHNTANHGCKARSLYLYTMAMRQAVRRASSQLSQACQQEREGSIKWHVVLEDAHLLPASLLEELVGWFYLLQHDLCDSSDGVPVGLWLVMLSLTPINMITTSTSASHSNISINNNSNHSLLSRIGVFRPMMSTLLMEIADSCPVVDPPAIGDPARSCLGAAELLALSDYEALVQLLVQMMTRRPMNTTLTGRDPRRLMAILQETGDSDCGDECYQPPDSRAERSGRQTVAVRGCPIRYLVRFHPAVRSASRAVCKGVGGKSLRVSRKRVREEDNTESRDVDDPPLLPHHYNQCWSLLPSVLPSYYTFPRDWDGADPATDGGSAETTDGCISLILEQLLTAGDPTRLVLAIALFYCGCVPQRRDAQVFSRGSGACDAAGMKRGALGAHASVEATADVLVNCSRFPVPQPRLWRVYQALVFLIGPAVRPGAVEASPGGRTGWRTLRAQCLPPSMASAALGWFAERQIVLFRGGSGRGQRGAVLKVSHLTLEDIAEVSHRLGIDIVQLLPHGT